MIKRIIIGLILLINYCYAQTISDTGITTHRYYVGSGLFIPNGPLDKIGMHPCIDIGTGANFKKTNIIVVYNLIFNKSLNPYEYTNSDTTFLTNRFFCFAPRIEVDRKLLKRNNFILELNFGFGYDFVNPVRRERKNHEYFKSYNVNLGLGGIFDIWNKSSFEPFIKYNFVDYSLHNHTNLKGGYLEIGIRYYYMVYK
jgi:hypothetical protein